MRHIYATLEAHSRREAVELGAMQEDAQVVVSGASGRQAPCCY